jgi:CRP-like cAMP-binding protein|tara:strand:- start:1699 stop:2457 length:759 start_codon:yes stop_codon:yes gene_type:complete
MAKANGNGLTELEKAFEEDMNLGFEEVSATNLQIPFLRIIQALSPQVKKSDGEFIEGAAQGNIFNTVTRTFWGDEGVVVIPTYFQMKFLEFVPRTQGGGFIGELSAASNDVLTAVRDKDTGMELLENGNELVRTAQHYVKLVHEDGSLESAIIDMKKTQLKRSRIWMSMMTMQKRNGKTLPSFAKTYRLKSVEDGNDKGSWYSWSVSVEGDIDGLQTYLECKDFHKSVSSGELQLSPPPPEAIGVSAEDLPF